MLLSSSLTTMAFDIDNERLQQRPLVGVLPLKASFNNHYSGNIKALEIFGNLITITQTYHYHCITEIVIVTTITIVKLATLIRL